MTNDFDLAAVRKHLIDLRTKHAGNLPVTMRISTLIEQLQEYETAPPDQRKMLQRLIDVNLIELAALSKGES